MQPVDEYYDEQAAKQMAEEEAAIEALRAESPAILPADAFLGEDAPTPGLYDGVPEEAYHALDACSNSRLTLLRRSPAHAKEAIESPTPSTKAQRIGTAAHWAILEPKVYAGRVDAAGQCQATTNKGSQCSYGGKVRVGGLWYCNRHAPQDETPDDLFVISEDDRDQIDAMQEAVHNHPTAGALVSMPGLAEATAVFDVDIEDVSMGTAATSTRPSSSPSRRSRPTPLRCTGSRPRRCRLGGANWKTFWPGMPGVNTPARGPPTPTTSRRSACPIGPGTVCSRPLPPFTAIHRPMKDKTDATEIDLAAVKVRGVMPRKYCRITISKSGGARFMKAATDLLELEPGEPLLFLRNEADPTDERIYLQFQEHEKAIEAKRYDQTIGFSGNGFRNAFGLTTDRTLHLRIGDPFIMDGQMTYPLTVHVPGADPDDEKPSEMELTTNGAPG